MINPNIHVNIHLDTKKNVKIEVESKEVTEMEHKYIILSLGYNTNLYLSPKQAEQIAKALLSEIQVLTSPEHAE